MKFLTVDELMEVPEDLGPWGSWAFDPQILVLRHSRWGHEVDIERIDSSAEALDWIIQIYKKQPDMDVVGLIAGLDAILDLQANYCSFGSDKRASGSELAKAFAERMTR